MEMEILDIITGLFSNGSFEKSLFSNGSFQERLGL